MVATSHITELNITLAVRVELSICKGLLDAHKPLLIKFIQALDTNCRLLYGHEVFDERRPYAPLYYMSNYIDGVGDAPATIDATINIDPGIIDNMVSMDNYKDYNGDYKHIVPKLIDLSWAIATIEHGLGGAHSNIVSCELTTETLPQCATLPPEPGARFFSNFRTVNE